MGDKITPNRWTSGPYFPSMPRTGNEGPNTSWRKSNLITRGRDGRFHEEAYSGSLSLDTGSVVEMVRMTGTITLTADSDQIIGVGTLFNTEAPYIGQRITVIPDDNSFSFLLVVKRIIDDEHMLVWSSDRGLPWPSVSGLVGWLMPRLYAIESQRGQSTWGNVLKLDQGSYLGVGLGTFLLDGEPLAGTSMTLTRNPSIALLNPLTATYTSFNLGMDTPAVSGFTMAAVGGGSKMQGGSYSYVVTPARKETVGYNNPTDRLDVTIATNDLVSMTFPAMDTANGQDAWIVWGTTFADTLGADLNYLNGPWHRFRLYDDTEVSTAGGTVTFEYYDAEIENNEIVTFNNDPPVDSTFVENFGPAPVWIGCQGQGWNLHPEATSPGPFIVPAKPNNVEAAPLDLAFSSSPPETIVGAYVANARTYLLTVNKLQIAQSTPSDVVPVLIRPFWHLGFACPEQLTFALGILYGYTVAGPARSAADGDESYIEHNWAADVYEFTKHWNPGQVLLAYDPYNDAVIYFHIADHLNAAGFWTTVWLMYGVPMQAWIGGGIFSSNNKDQIVCGVATVADRLEYIFSGRRTT